MWLCSNWTPPWYLLPSPGTQSCPFFKVQPSGVSIKLYLPLLVPFFISLALIMISFPWYCLYYNYNSLISFSAYLGSLLARHFICDLVKDIPSPRQTNYKQAPHRDKQIRRRLFILEEDFSPHVHFGWVRICPTARLCTITLLIKIEY